MTEIIRDQREMVGPGRHETVEEVERAWESWLAENPPATRRRRGDNSIDLRDSGKVVQAYISGGKWIADCPYCNGGVACWRENPRGACLDCATLYLVEFPSEQEERDVVELLAARPDPMTRSWHRHRGETVETIAAENDRYLAETSYGPPARHVAVDEVERVLGGRAVERLRREGVV